MTTNSNHSLGIAANVLEGNFIADTLNRKWAGDISYICWLYFAIVLKLHSRRAVGWPTRRQADAAIFQYINGFYNLRRRHSYLDGISHLAFKAKVA